MTLHWPRRPRQQLGPPTAALRDADGRGEVAGWPAGLPAGASVPAELAGAEEAPVWYEWRFSISAPLRACASWRLLLPGREAEPFAAWLDGSPLPAVGEGEWQAALEPSRLSPGGSAGGAFRLVLRQGSPGEGVQSPRPVLEAVPDAAILDALPICRPGGEGLEVRLQLSEAFGRGPYRWRYAVRAEENEEDLPVEGELFAGRAAVLPARACRPWSPADPTLYRVRLEVADARGVADTVQFRCGLRTVALTTNGLRLNGERVGLRGVRVPRTNLTDPPAWVAAARAAGVNLLWLCGDGPLSGWVDAAEEAGLLLAVELSGAGLPAAARSPAVVLWAVDRTVADPEQTAQALRGLDPGRPVCLAPDAAGAGAASLFGGGGEAWQWRPRAPVAVREAAGLLAAGRGEVPWVVLGAPPTGSEPSAGERLRSGFDALGLAPRWADPGALLEAGEALAWRALRRAALAAVRSPHCGGVLLDVPSGELARALEALQLPSCCWPEEARAVPEGEEAPVRLLGPDEEGGAGAVGLRFGPAAGGRPHWRREVCVPAAGEVEVRLESAGLPAGELALAAEAPDPNQPADAVRVTILPPAARPACTVVTAEPAAARALGLEQAARDDRVTVLLSLADTLLEQDPAALARALATAEAGGTVLFLGTPRDAAPILVAAGLLEEPFRCAPTGPLGRTVPFGRHRGLFDGLPGEGFLDEHWRELWPQRLLLPTGGQVHAGALCRDADEPWRATVLETACGAGRLVFTTFRWQASLGRNVLADTLLARLSECFRPRDDCRPPSAERIGELEKRLRAARSARREWQVMGPLAAGLAALSEPLAAEAGPEAPARAEGLGGKALRWRPCYTEPGTSEILDFGALEMPLPGGSWVATTSLRAEAPRTVPVSAACEWPLRIALDGEPVWCHAGGARCRLVLHLRPGENQLTVRVVGAPGRASAPGPLLELRFGA
jgi:hypothetical protein